MAGDEIGRVLTFTGNSLTAVQSTSHKTAITGLCVTTNDRIITASRDLIVTWNEVFEELHSIEIAQLQPSPTDGAVPVSAGVDGTNNRILLGFNDSQLYELTLDYR